MHKASKGHDAQDYQCCEKEEVLDSKKVLPLGDSRRNKAGEPQHTRGAPTLESKLEYALAPVCG